MHDFMVEYTLQLQRTMQIDDICLERSLTVHNYIPNDSSHTWNRSRFSTLEHSNSWEHWNWEIVPLQNVCCEQS